MKDEPGARDYRSRPGLSQGSVPDAEEAPDAAPVPSEERWQTLSALGSGGMGKVELVADRWLDRSVAVKRPASEADARRLWREALITARLEHPGIVPIYDVGRAPAPWFAMRVVRGQSLGELIRQTPSLTDRLTLLRNVLAACEAVGYAHKKGIVHRDLKPDNLMIGAFGETQVIDWGLALVSDELGLPTGDDRAGTPGYMSPEQERGGALDARTDVYSLGAVLFELVVGGQGEPRRVSLLEACPEAPAELAAIVSRAMASAPADRYPDAKALALDLAAYLDGRRVGAHQYSPRELFARLLKAWRLPLSIVAVALVLLGVLIVLGVDRITAERNQAEANLAVALLVEGQRALTERRLGEAEVLATAALERSQDATLSAEARGVLVALGPTRPDRSERPGPPCRPSAIDGTRSLCATTESIAVYEGSQPLWSQSLSNRGAGFIADGGAIAVLANEGPVARSSLFTLDSRTGSALGERRLVACNAHLRSGPDSRSVTGWGVSCAEQITLGGIEATPEGLCGSNGLMQIATHGTSFVASCNDGMLALGTFGEERVRRLEAEHRLVGAPPLTSALAFVGADAVLLGGADGSVVWLSSGGERERVVLARQRGIVRQIIVSPDERLAVVLADESSPLVLDLGLRTELLRLPDPDVSSVQFDAAGTLTAVGRRAVAWDLRPLRPRSWPFAGGITALAVSHDGSMMGVAHGQQVTLLSLPDGVTLRRERWQDSVYKGLAFDPSDHLVSHGMGSERVVRFARAGPVTDLPPLAATRWRRLVMLAGGSVLASTWDPLQALLRRDHPAEIVSRIPLIDLAASADGRSLALVTTTGELQCAHDFESTRSFWHCGVDDMAQVLAVADAEHVLAGGSGGVNAWRVSRAGQQLEVRHEAPGVEVTALAVSRDYVAAGARDGSVWWWRRGEATPLSITRAHTDRIAALTFGPDAAWLACGGWDGTVDFLSPPDALAPTHAIARRAWGLTLADTFGRPGFALE